MLDLITKLATISVSGAGALVAFLVYRINADKLFLEMLVTRRTAAQEVLDAAHARDREAMNLPAAIGAAHAYDLPEQARFWRATTVADGLFGPEVVAVLEDLDRALMEKVAALLSLRDPSENIEAEQAARQRFGYATADLQTRRQAFVEVIKPYTNLGRRGLSIGERWRLSRAPRVQRIEADQRVDR